MFVSLPLQYVAVLDVVLSKLSRYDEGTLFSSLLSFTVSLSHSSVKELCIHLCRACSAIELGYIDTNFCIHLCLKVKAAAKYVDVPVSMLFHSLSVIAWSFNVVHKHTQTQIAMCFLMLV